MCIISMTVGGSGTVTSCGEIPEFPVLKPKDTRKDAEPETEETDGGNGFFDFFTTDPDDVPEEIRNRRFLLIAGVSAVLILASISGS